MINYLNNAEKNEEIKKKNESLKSFAFKGSSSEIKIDDTIDRSIIKAEKSFIFEFIRSLRESLKTRKDYFDVYNKMSADSTIATALDMLSSDATQQDPVRGRSIWAVSENLDLENELNEFLEEINIEEMLYAIAYGVLKDGEVFIKTYYTEVREELEKIEANRSAKLEGLKPPFNEDKIDLDLCQRKGLIYEIVPNTCSVADLTRHGKTIGYYFNAELANERTNTSSSYSNIYQNNYMDREEIIYPVHDYIHFINDTGQNRERIFLKQDASSVEFKEFIIRYGKSYLESAIDAFEKVDILEASLIAARTERSTLFRIFKLNAGDLDEQQANSFVQEFKSSVETRESFDKNRGYDARQSPISMNSNLYVTVRPDGKGEIEMTPIGGDFDPKSIIDIESQRNKLFGALQIPKAYMGFEEGISGGIGNQSLARIDIRYAKNIKRVMNILKSGVKKMCVHYLISNGRGHLQNDFKIEMTNVLSEEEKDRKDNISGNLETLAKLKELLPDNPYIPSAIAKYISDNFGIDLDNAIEDERKA